MKGGTLGALPTSSCGSSGARERRPAGALTKRNRWASSAMFLKKGRKRRQAQRTPAAGRGGRTPSASLPEADRYHSPSLGALKAHSAGPNAHSRISPAGPLVRRRWLRADALPPVRGVARDDLSITKDANNCSVPLGGRVVDVGAGAYACLRTAGSPSNNSQYLVKQCQFDGWLQ